MKRKLSWHFWAVCAVIAAALIAVSFYFGRAEEFAYEMADLQAMRDAEAAAMLAWKDRLPEEAVEYWYNTRNFKLIPASEPIPVSRGTGTGRIGGAVKAFEAETGRSFPYDEGESYTGKFIHVLVSDDGGELKTAVDWVDADRYD